MDPRRSLLGTLSKLSTQTRCSRYEAEVTCTSDLAREYLCIFFLVQTFSDVFSPAAERVSLRLSLSLSAWFNGSTILQRAVIPGAPRAPVPRRDDGHPGQGRWMQQLNRVMRIARVKILIGPQLDDVGRLYTVSSLTFDR